MCKYNLSKQDTVLRFDGSHQKLGRRKNIIFYRKKMKGEVKGIQFYS